MFELRFDTENSLEEIMMFSGYIEYSYEYYDVYLNGEPVYRELNPNPIDPAILSLAINRREKYIELINASEHIFYRIGSSRYKLYDLIISLMDELEICSYRICIMEPPDDHNDIMTNELAYEINKTYPDYNIETII